MVAALIGSVLVVLILNIAPGALGIQLQGQAHLLYVLVSLFIGVITYVALNQQ